MLVRVACRLLPTYLPLPAGTYGDPARGGLAIAFSSPSIHPGDHDHLDLWHLVNIPDTLPLEKAEMVRGREASELHRRINRLIRWCRTIGGQAALAELTLGLVGAIRFTIEPQGQPWGEVSADLTRVSSVTPIAPAVEQIARSFATGEEPPVSDLFLVDAQHSIREGRFRECVLLCWSAIDATFNQKFELLVKAKLADEWAESREFLMGPDFGLRHKMAIGLRLVAGQSLYRQGDDFWLKLSASYRNRNKIIHEGAIVSENEAELALWVARRVVQVMQQVKPS